MAELTSPQVQFQAGAQVAPAAQIPMEGMGAGQGQGINVPQSADTRIPTLSQPFPMIDAQKAKADYAHHEADFQSFKTEQQVQLDQQALLEEARRDKMIMTQGRDTGLDFYSPEGLRKTAAELGPRLSPRATQNLFKQADEQEKSKLMIRELTSKLTDEERTTAMRQQDDLVQLYVGPVGVYRSLKKAGKPEAEVKSGYDAALAAAAEAATAYKKSDGSAQYTPQQLEAFAKLPPEQLANLYEHSATQQRWLKEALANEHVAAASRAADALADWRKDGGMGSAKVKDIKWAQGVIRNPDSTEEEVATARKLIEKDTTTTGGTGSRGILKLTDEQNKALFGPQGAVTTGRVDYRKVNSRTAALLADAVITNPNTDLEGLSARLNLARNPQFEQKAMIAEILPEILQNVVTAGKKVDFSNINFIGKLEAFSKHELNDPDFTSYMVQRNDALLTIGGVMRGNGMTDMAQKVETEAASPTMSPQALDAWLEGQMKALAPRLKKFEELRGKKPDVTGPGSDQASILKGELEKEKNLLLSDTSPDGGALHTKNIEEIKAQMKRLGIPVESQVAPVAGGLSEARKAELKAKYKL